MTPKHKECQEKLLKIGTALELKNDRGKGLGKMYHMGCPDVVWYYDCSDKEPLMKIAEGDRCNLIREKIKNSIKIKKKCNIHGSCRYLPLVAFEVSNEEEKALRGSIMTLLLVNAAASIIVIIGKSDKKHESFAEKLTGRFSFARLRVWTEKDVDELYDKVVKKEDNHCVDSGKLKSALKHKYDIAIGERSLVDLKSEIAEISKTKVKISGRSYKTGKKKIIRIPLASLLS